MKRLPYLAFFAFCLISQACFASVTFTATKVCLLTQTTLTGASSFPDSVVTGWKWDLDNDGLFNDGSGKILNHFFTQSDTFSVGLRITTKTGITESASGTVVVFPLPQVNFRVDNPCEGKTAIFKDLSAISDGNITQYNWDFNNDGITDNNSGPEVTFNCGPAATYLSRLECVSDKGCKAFNIKTTQVFHLPAADFSVADNCLGDSTVFTNKTSLENDAIAFYKWQLGDGTESSGISPSHRYTASQAYTVTLVAVSQNNCKDTLQRSITIHPAADAAISFSGDTVLYSGESVNITANGNITAYEWSTGETGSSITASQNGIVTLKYTDTNGCTGSKSVNIIVRNADQASTLNNLVTPNGDGVNDNFVIENVEAYESCTLTIFNSWNEVIYRTTNYRNDWSGTYNGKPVDAGTYYYIISCSDQKEKAGSISILR